MDALWDFLNSVLQPVFDEIAVIIDPLLKELAPLGLSEPVIQFMLINAILGISIYLTLYCGMFSLANAGFMAVGAYVSAILTTQHGASYGEGLLYGMIAAGIIAIPVGLPVLRLRNIYLAIATIGFGEVVRLIILNFDKLAINLRDSAIYSPIVRPVLEVLVEDVDARRLRITYGPQGITRIPRTTETSHIIVFLVVTCYFLYRFHHSRMGRAMAAIRQDEKVAASQGINVVFYKNVAFFMGALLASAAGVFNTHAIGIVEPGAFDFNRAVNILAYAVLGGLENWVGPILGGLTLTALPEVLREMKEYNGVITGTILLLIIVYMPGGLTSLFRLSFWTEGGSFETAKRIALAGIIMVILANLLPYRRVETAESRILGYEVLKLYGNLIIATIFIWILYIPQNPAGNYYSRPLTAVAIGMILLFVGFAATNTLENITTGYYVQLLGMGLGAVAGLIRYPPEQAIEVSE